MSMITTMTTTCQLAHPEKEVPPRERGWVEYMAEVAYGTHEYQVTTPPIRFNPSHSRTVEGGLFVTASVSVVLAILLRTTSDVVAAVPTVQVTEPQFYAALAIVPPLASLVQAKGGSLSDGRDDGGVGRAAGRPAVGARIVMILRKSDRSTGRS